MGRTDYANYRVTKYSDSIVPNKPTSEVMQIFQDEEQRLRFDYNLEKMTNFAYSIHFKTQGAYCFCQILEKLVEDFLVFSDVIRGVLQLCRDPGLISYENEHKGNRHVILVKEAFMSIGVDSFAVGLENHFSSFNISQLPDSDVLSKDARCCMVKDVGLLPVPIQHPEQMSIYRGTKVDPAAFVYCIEN